MPVESRDRFEVTKLAGASAWAHTAERAVLVLFGPDTFEAFRRALGDLAAKA